MTTDNTLQVYKSGYSVPVLILQQKMSEHSPYCMHILEKLLYTGVHQRECMLSHSRVCSQEDYLACQGYLGTLFKSH